MNNAQFSTNQILKVCQDKLEIEFKSTKEYNGWYMLDGKCVCRITIPKGRKEVPLKTYTCMAKQLKLTTWQFDILLQCTLTRKDMSRLFVV